MSWDAAWGNNWGSAFGDSVALTLADTAHASSVDAVTLASISLLMADSTHALRVDSINLGAIGLSVADAVHSHLSDGILLAQAINNVAAWGSSWGVSFGVSWGASASLVVADARHVVLADTVTLTNIGLLIADARSSVASDQVIPLVSSTLTVGETTHNHLSDAVILTQAHWLAVGEALHNHLADDTGYFIIPELRLNGTLFGGSGTVTLADVQCAVIPGTTLYGLAPVLQTSAIAINNGQIAIQYSGFGFADIGNDYMVILYKPGSPRVGGGPFPAIMVDANA